MSIPKECVYALKRDLQDYALGITGKRFLVVPIPENSPEIGFTANGNKIHVSFNNEYTKKLSKEKSLAFVEGVFVHELMHQIMTPFIEFKGWIDKITNPIAARIFATIYNVIEDPAIEYFAPEYIGGHLLKSLHFTIATTYKEAPDIDSSDDPFGQFFAALIHYGDGGLIKGAVASKEALKCLTEALPLIDKAIVEPRGTKRLEYACEVYKISKPLWEEMANDAINDLLQSILQETGKGGSNQGDSNGATPSGSGTDDSANRKNKRRKVTYKKVTKEEMEKLKQNAQNSPGTDDGTGDITVVYCDEDEDSQGGGEEDGKNGAPVPSPKSKGQDDDSSQQNGSSGDTSQKDADGEPDDQTNGNDAAASDSTEDQDGEPSDNVNGQDGESSDSADGDPSDQSEEKSEKGDGDGDDASGNASNEPQDGKSDDAGETDNSTPSEEIDPASGEILDDGLTEDVDLELTAEDLEALANHIEEMQNDAGAQRSAALKLQDEDFDEPGLDAFYAGAHAVNIKVSIGDQDAAEVFYNNIVTPMRAQIDGLVSQLQRIFKNKNTDREYRCTGRFEPTRMVSGRMTPRVFSKERVPSKKDGFCVEIICDESGSMSGHKIDCAKKCAIALAETFGALKVPTMIFGYSADESHPRSDVSHYHYLHWDMRQAERLRLLNIEARYDNFDGYSIRYATSQIKKRKEHHKILIIISDGAPNCNFYHEKHISGCADTAKALEEAEKVADVIGLGIGDVDAGLMHQMYKDHFVLVSNVDQLFAQISTQIKRITKGW